MATYRLKIWTGPTLAKPISKRAKLAKLRVTSTGTEHIYVDVKASKQNGCEGAKHNMRAAFMRKFGRDYSLRVRDCWLRERK